MLPQLSKFSSLSKSTNYRKILLLESFQMLTEVQRRRIKLYSPAERRRVKSERRRADAAEVALGRAEQVQERNRALPAAAEFVFSEREEALPME
jgi:hypothetical protein